MLENKTYTDLYIIDNDELSISYKNDNGTIIDITFTIENEYFFFMNKFKIKHSNDIINKTILDKKILHCYFNKLDKKLLLLIINEYTKDNKKGIDMVMVDIPKKYQRLDKLKKLKKNG